MIKKLFFIASILSVGFIFAQTSSPAKKYQDKVKRYLDKENALAGYYSIDSSGISMFQSPENKAKHDVEFKIYWDELKWTEFLFANFSPKEIVELLNEKKDVDMYANAVVGQENTTAKSQLEVASPLKGLRIAIDPGHMAKTLEMAKIEKKYIDMKADAKTGLKQDVQLIEAELNLATALLLKEQLEKAGATVMLTRTQNDETAFGMSFSQWMQTSFKAAVDTALANKDITEDEKQFLLTKADEKEIFRKLFFTLENKERARKINAFAPNYTVVIHYNVDEKNTDWKKPTNKNFNMTFVGGSFMKEDLEKPIYRTEFLRLLLSNDIENSANFSSYFVKSFERNLNVPTAKVTDADYLKQYCLPTEKPGVYCRNLTLTRMVRGTLVYGETLYQDNIKELELLSQKDVTVNGITTSKRVQQVANAYYEGMVNYVNGAK